MIRIVIHTIFLGLLVWLAYGCTSHKKIHEKHLINLGEKSVKLKMLQSGQDGLCFFNMHEDERTSVKVTKKFLKKQKGTIFYIKHGGGRNIKFELDNEIYAFDPNRIFTDEGIRQTMMRFGAYNSKAHEEVRRFASELLRLVDLPNRQLIIALHNNTENRYSSSSYLPGQRYEIDASAVYQNTSLDHDDFFFVTDSTWFHMLASLEQNVVLQDTKLGTDDGSLSIYCGQSEITYVNVEAQHGHKRQQLQMLEFLQEASDSLLPASTVIE